MIGDIIGTTIGGLTNHLWQSTLFAVAAGLLTVAFRKNRAQVRYWLWLGASLKFFVPFSLLMSLGSHLQWAPAAKSVATQAVSFTMVQLAQPFPDTLPFAPSAPRATDWLAIAILGVWACGFGTIALVRFRDWLRIRAAVRSSTRLEIPAAIEVRSFPGRMEPGVVGLLRPVLLLPAGVLERLTPPQLTAVLAHELCHVRRRDNLTAAMHMIVEAVFWFHPLVWWIGARLVEERERACDEEVLRLGSEPQVYAESILNVCKFYVESPLRCVSGVTGSDLKKRIQRIMKDRLGLALSGWKKLLLAMAGVVASAAPLVAGVLAAPRLRAQAPAAQSSAAAVGRPAFDAASIKQDKSGIPNMYVEMPGGLYRVTRTTLRRLVGAAYLGDPGKGKLIFGGPDWIDSERFDIEARAEGSPGIEQKELMLQSLLEDRFKLTMHHESRQIPAFALVLSKSGKLGPQLHPHSDATKCFDLSAGQLPPIGPGAAPQALCGGVWNTEDGSGKATMVGSGMTMEKLVAIVLNRLNIFSDRLIVDRTGLSGAFDWRLEYDQIPISPPDPSSYLNGPSQSGPPQPPRDPSGAPLLDAPSFLAAMQEQLGLKLKPEKGPVDVLVIDHVEQPSPN